MSDPAAPDLRVRFGSAPGKSFRIRGATVDVEREEGRIREGTIASFREGKIAIAFSGELVNRLFILEPADEENRFEWPPFGIEGRYRVVEKVNNPAEASRRFREFAR